MSTATSPAIETALSVTNLGKFFRLPRAKNGALDPRREAAGRRDKFWALREIDFSVRTGQTLGIVGHNGSGKSTLLKILAGVMTPDEGEFKAQGRIGALLELGAGFHPDLTGLDNVYLNGALLGMTIQQIDRVLPEIIEFAELERFMDMPVRHYSSGMHSRLGFAVATRLAPEILLMDETFATGDARFQAKALAHIGAMRARGHTLVLVSHSLELLYDLADEVLWLDHGRKRAQGKSRDVLPEYRQSQQAAHRSVEMRRGQGGLGAMFPLMDAAPGPVRLGKVNWEEAGDEITAGPETPPALHVELLHDAQPEARSAIFETAWQRLSDNRVLAQSRTRVPLQPGAERSEIKLRLTHNPLHAERWRIGIAVRLEGEHDAESAGGTILYSDRRELLETVRTTLPQREIETVMESGARWEVESDPRLPNP